MKQVTVVTKSDDIIAHVFIENNEVKAILRDEIRVIIDEVELAKEVTTIANRVDDYTVINDEKYIKESSLTDFGRTQKWLIETLESIDVKNATPEMLEASASIAKLLL